MSSFLVLGLIPGTPIQITFLLWIVGVVGAVVGTVIWFAHRAHIFRDYYVTAMLVFAVRREPTLR